MKPISFFCTIFLGLILCVPLVTQAAAAPQGPNNEDLRHLSKVVSDLDSNKKLMDGLALRIAAAADETAKAKMQEGQIILWLKQIDIACDGWERICALAKQFPERVSVQSSLFESLKRTLGECCSHPLFEYVNKGLPFQKKQELGFYEKISRLEKAWREAQSQLVLEQARELEEARHNSLGMKIESFFASRPKLLILTSVVVGGAIGYGCIRLAKYLNAKRFVRIASLAR